MKNLRVGTTIFLCEMARREVNEDKSDLRPERKIYSFPSIKNIKIADMILYE